MPTFLLRWGLFQAYSYTDRLVVIVLRKLHVHSGLGSSINLSFACDLTLVSQLINLVPLFRACSSDIQCNKSQALQIQKILLIKYCYFKNTHREKASSNKTPALTKGINIDICLGRWNIKSTIYKRFLKIIKQLLAKLRSL